MDKNLSEHEQLFELNSAPQLLADVYPSLPDSSRNTLAAAEDRVYGQVSPARLEFNKSFDKFRALQELLEPPEAFVQTRQDFLSSIDQADDYTEKAESAFYKELSSSAFSSFGPSPGAIEKLQLFSAALTGLPPQDRHELMRELAEGKNSGLYDFPELKVAFENLPDSMAARSKSDLLRAWFNYRAGIGDSIGQRQVYIGLSDRFGSSSEARQQELKVQEYKNRIGGRFVFD